jgi:hypothetical protein
MTESDTPWEPPLSGTLARRVTSTSQETVCATCHLIHAGECD